MNPRKRAVYRKKAGGNLTASADHPPSTWGTSHDDLAQATNASIFARMTRKSSVSGASLPPRCT